MSSVEEQAALIAKDLILRLQLEKMTQQSFGSRVHPPKKPLTKATEEAIKDYNKQFKVVQYEMEIDENGNNVMKLDEDGKPIPLKRKYQSIPPPELERVNAEELAPFDEETQLERLQDFEYINKELFFVNKAFKEINSIKKTLTEELNNLYVPQFDSSLSRKQNIYLQKKYEDHKNEILEKLKEIDDALIHGKQIESKFKDEITLKQNQEQLDMQRKSHNEAVKSGVEQRNKLKIQSYQEALNLMNKGAFTMEKKPEESEEEYLNRLQMNAEEETIEESQFEAQEYIRKKFKEHLKELVRDDSIIESVSNEIKQLGEDEEISIKLSINKTFPKFKQLFIEIYGKNNSSIDSSDIFQFIKSYTEGKEDDYIRGIIKTNIKQSNQITQAPKRSIVEILNKKNGEKIYLMPIIGIAENELGGTYELLWSRNIKRNSFRQISENYNFDDIKSLTGITKKMILEQIDFKTKNVKEVKPDRISDFLIKIKKIVPITYQDIEKPFQTYDEEYGEEIYGWGVKPEKIPEVVPFGKILLHLHKLYYKNNLVVKHKDNSNIIGMPNIKVSDEFVKVIMKLVKGDKIKNSDLNSLKTIELHLYNRLIMLADLHKSHQIDSEKTIEYLKHKLALLTGEIESGNDAKELVKELHWVVHSLKNFGVISIKEANDFMKQINF